MKFYISIVLLILLASLNSCSIKDPVPTSGEKSFVAKLDGKRFVAEDRLHFPSGTIHGLHLYVRNNSWGLTITNSSGIILYIYINEVNEPGNYLIKDGNRNVISPDPAETPTSAVIRNRSLNLLFVTSMPNENEYIKIIKVQGDSIIIGEFEKIILTDPENPDNKTILTDGKFNINRNTLNQPEP